LVVKVSDGCREFIRSSFKGAESLLPLPLQFCMQLARLLTARRQLGVRFVKLLCDVGQLFAGGDEFRESFGTFRCRHNLRRIHGSTAEVCTPTASEIVAQTMPSF